MIPQIQPWIDDSEWLEVKQVIESTYLTENKVTAKFEAGIKELTGAEHAIAVCNGTAALYCAVKRMPGPRGQAPTATQILRPAKARATRAAAAAPA